MTLSYHSLIARQARGTKVNFLTTGGALQHCQYKYECKMYLLERHWRCMLSTNTGRAHYLGGA